MKNISKILTAITVLTALALAQPPGPEAAAAPGKRAVGPGAKQEFPNPMIIKELNLNAKQKKELKEYRHKMKKEKIRLHSEIAQLQEDLRFKFSEYPLNKSDIENLKKKLIGLHGKITSLRIDAMLHFLGSLTKEQHQKFVDLQENYGFKKFGKELGGKPGKGSSKNSRKR